MTLFFGLHFILGGKLEVERRENLFFYFQWKRKLRPPFSNFWERPCNTVINAALMRALCQKTSAKSDYCQVRLDAFGHNGSQKPLAYIPFLGTT